MPEVDPNQHDRFTIKQIVRPVVNRYEIALSETPDEPFLFVEQKRFKLKEDIGFFGDAARSEERFRIKARQAFDPTARYDVTAADGTRIGDVQKVFGASLLRSTYRLHTLADEEIVVRERSAAVALLRRAAGMISDVGDWLPIPYHFEFLRGDQVIGSHERVRWKLRDTYVMDLSADTERVVDRRLALALAVALDALQAR